MLENILSHTEDDFTQLFNTISVGVMVLDERASITKVNDSLLEFFNSTQENFKGKRFGDAFQCKHSILNEKGCGFDPNCEHCELNKAVRQVLKSEEKTIKIEFRKSILFDQGERDYWFKVAVSPMMQGNAKKSVITFEDITDGKNKEISLKESRDYYYIMCENFPSLIWRTDLNGNGEYFNKSWIEFVGKRNEDCLGTKWLELVHPEDRGHYFRLQKDAFKNKKPFRVEYRILNKSGEYRWIQAIYGPSYEIDGNPGGYIGVGVDITDRKNLEEGLIQYKMLSEKVRDTILFIEKESGRIIDANLSAIKLYGYTREELLELTICDLRNESNSFIMEQMEKSDSEGVFFETWHKNKEETLIPVEGSSKGTTLNGKRVFLNIIRDISERKNSEKALKESEEKFRQVFNHSVDAKFVQEANIDGTQGKLIEVSQTACDMLGYEYDEFFLMKEPLIELIRPSHGWENYFQELAEKGHTTFKASARLMYWKLLPVEVMCSQCYINDVKVTITTIRDITKWVEAEGALSLAKQEAEIANKAKSEFLANMSHEIRTPLNGIVGMVDLMRLSKLSPDQQENIAIVKTCVNALLNVINDILDFSKMEAGKLVVKKTNFDIKSLIEHTIKAQSPHALAKGIELNYAFSATMPQYLVGDSQRIQQILNNLTSNAIKFTENGEVWLIAKKISTENNMLTVMFTVEDSGIGIAEENLKGIFESFSQVDGSYTRRFGGTGLGLAITKQLVENMGGKIWALSKIGNGSKFYFTLSFDIGTAIPEQPEIKREVYQINKSYKILITEDDKVNQIVIARMLKECGYSVEIANNGFEAVKMARENDYDIILMDIQMPEMDGIEATKRIREYNQQTPILAITAYALHGDRERFMEQGMDEYISKPIKLEKLICAIEKCIAKKDKDENFSNIGICVDGNGEFVIKEKVKKQRVVNEELKIEKLSKVIDGLQANIVSGEFTLLEKLANQIKSLAIELDIEDLKTLAFKIELDIRRGNFDLAVEKAKSVNQMFEVFKKTVL